MRHAENARFLSALVAAALLLGASAGCSTEGDVPSAAQQQQPAAAADTTDSTTAAPPTSTTQGRSVEERIEDASLVARVKTALVENRQLRTLDLQPRATDGRVTLAGNVATRGQGRTAAEVAAEVDGVDDVLNRLTVDGQQVAWNSDSGSASGEQVAASGTPAAPGPSDGSTSGNTYHTVRTGESLWAIASEYGTSVSRVKRLNNLRGNGLQPGDRLLVKRGGGGSSASGGTTVAAAGGAQNGSQQSGAEGSSADTSEGSASGSEATPQAEEKAVEYHVVERGETLWAIAEENNMTVGRLRELNGLSGNDLMPGDRLRVE